MPSFLTSEHGSHTNKQVEATLGYKRFCHKDGMGERDRIRGGMEAGREGWKRREVLERIYNVQESMLDYMQISYAILHECFEHECVLLYKR